MPLTPADIRNARFTIEFRGYSQKQVDDFLEQVERDLVSRIENEGRLRAQLADRETEAAARHRAPEEPQTNPAIAIRTAPGQPPIGGGPVLQPSEPERISKILALATEAAEAHKLQAEASGREIIRDAKRRAQALLAQAEEQAAETTAGLEQTVATLEGRVEELRGIAQEYQAHLTTHLEQMLVKVRNTQFV